MEVRLVHRAFPHIAVSNEFIVEMLFDNLTLEVLGPILPLLDQSGSVGPTFLQLNNSLQHAKPTVKNNNIALSKDWLHNSQQQSK